MRGFLAWVSVLLLSPSLVQSQRLPIRTYTTADGLARDYVHAIVQDSRGFLWFATVEGLSRFDGYQFTNYRVEQGLPDNSVTAFLESRQGDYWVATRGGLCRFHPAGGAARFERYPLGQDGIPRRPVVLFEDRAGGIWCGARTGIFPPKDGGVFYLAPKDTAFRRVNLSMTDTTVTAVLVDRRGTLWVGSPSGLYSRTADGAARSYAGSKSLSNQFIMALLEDRAGRLWVATRFGLVRMDPASGSPLGVYTIKDGLPAVRVQSLLETSDGRLWVGTSEGLAEWTPGHSPGGREFQSYTAAEGLSANGVEALAEDRDRNLWVGTYGGGVMKVARGGFTTFSEPGWGPGGGSLAIGRRGELIAVYNRPRTEPGITRFDGRRFLPIRPAWPGQTVSGWGGGQVALQDRAGEWWIATGRGLCRFARTDRVEQLAGAHPIAVYTTRDGLHSNNIFRVFEDSRGGIWIGTIGPNLEDGLARWDRRTNSLRVFSEVEGLPRQPSPTGFAEDRSGAIWISLYHNALVRYRGGRFTVFTESDGILGFLNTVFADSAGRLWIGTTNGLVRVDDPAADRPQFVNCTVAQGLASNDVAALVEDRWGRLYAATGRGIDRFEPQPGSLGRIKHYTTADGIVGGELDMALRDAQGNLWFGSNLGVSRFVPARDPRRAPPPVLVTGLNLGGVPLAVSDLGQSAVSGLRLTPTPLRIDFVGLGFSPGETLRYQYKLEGADAGWSAPTDQRAVVYARLAAGSYRFLVRAVTSTGTVSPEPASVAFTILPPFWRTWWFVTACGLLAAFIIYALYRYRVAHVLAVANVRTRIATDLHDDIGASLSQIAILSELARRTVNGADARNGGPLSDIAGISRELVDAMSDIVWATNPDHDHLSNLAHRMRRFAADVLGGQNIALQFHSSIDGHDLRMGGDVRRQVYLIFKEAIHNIARHSGAGRVEVGLDHLHDTLVLHLRDDGRGFDPAAQYEGRGLNNMRKRAAALRARVELDSGAGRGTTLTLTVSLDTTILAGLRGT